MVEDKLFIKYSLYILPIPQEILASGKVTLASGQVSSVYSENALGIGMRRSI